MISLLGFFAIISWVWWSIVCVRSKQAIRSKEDQLLITKSDSSEDLTRDNPTKENTPVYEEVSDNQVSVHSSGFRESLEFFQSQIKRNVKTEGKQENSSVSSSSRSEFVVRKPTEKSVSRNSCQSAPSTNVDSILQSVRLIRATQFSGGGNAPCSDSEQSDKENLSPDEPSSVSKQSIELTPFAMLQKTRRPGAVNHSLGKSSCAEDLRCDAGETPERRPDVESDLDSQDFVVHNNTFYGQDIAEELLEDAYSSVNEDGEQHEYHVQHPDDHVQAPDTPSPDYDSSEEYNIISGTDGERDPFYDEDDNDFIDNSASYLTDPRRYVYYADEKELEVIPEEDEEEFEDEDIETSGEVHSDYCEGSSYKEDTYKENNCGESDSGVTDGHHSSVAEDEVNSDKGSASTADSDSAQGSLWPDSTAGSPSVIEKPTYRASIDLQSPELPEHNSNIENSLIKSSSFETKHHELVELPISQMNNINTEDYFPKRGTVEARLKQLEIGSGKRNIKEGSKDAMVILSEFRHSVPDVVEDTRRSRSSTINWDPTDLLMELYKIEISSQDRQESTTYVNTEGYLEKLPSGRKSVTYWNPWKRKYFCARDGFLCSYDSIQSEKPNQKIQLMGGVVEVLDNNVIGIDDKKGHYVVVRCQDEEETEDWFRSLQTQCRENFNMTYIQPVRYPLKSHKDVIIVDLGSCSIRAGVLMDHPTLPQVFFPTICATDKYYSENQVFGIEALKPNIRCSSNLSFPVSQSAKITKYTMDVEKLSGLFKKVFQELNVDPRKYKVQVCVPRSFSIQTQSAILKTLFEEFGVCGVNLTHQAILSLYAYNSTSGIVVDIGDRMDIVPITYGYIVESGVTRLPYGGQRMLHHLRHALTQKHVSLISDIEAYIIRYVQEKACFVSRDYKKDLENFRENLESIEKTLTVKQFFQTECPTESISIDIGRFQTPEGLFTPELWGLDYPGIHKLVHRAFQECSMDIRREMVRSIYLSGGVTLLPGFAERLETEIDRLTPPAIVPKVHASPHRYHMAYLGACRLAASDGFHEACASKEEWSKKGSECLKRWHL
ncbi:uncharacterized protein LOC106462082 isoform X2 [Limulus polyphemus]|uniref:Uncharacterized protein LOC106462082 isoform X2 n=1 Tax=Limulus polyphemus TaxID=6850 RepID=A0ABM1SMR7_LIMPO|nr:uncharacterized protein LOC106462082 isoform X2 [Limulus polyphemus]